MVNQSINSSIVEHAIQAFVKKNPNVEIPQELSAAVSNAENCNTIFQQGANEQYDKWREFTHGYNANKAAHVNHQTVGDLDDAIHSYMDWEKPKSELLTDAEKAQYNVKNYRMNNKGTLSGFLKYRKKNKQNNKPLGLIKSFKEYKAKINSGSYKYFLKHDYPNAANTVITSLKDVKREAKYVDPNLQKTIGEIAHDFRNNTIVKAKKRERMLFGTFKGKNVAKKGLIGAAALVGIGCIYNLVSKVREQEKIWQNNNNDEFTNINLSDNSTDAVSENSSTVLCLNNINKQKPTLSTSEENINSTSINEKNPELKDNINSDIAERRRLFELAVNKARTQIDLSGVESESYTIVKGDSLWKIAKKTLVNEGVANPPSQEIVKRIAIIALLNEQIEKVTEYMLLPGKTLKVPNKATVAFIENNEEYSKILSILTEIYA